MANKPRVSIAFSNNNLLQNIQNIDGYAAFIGTGQQAGNLGKIFIINSLAEAVTQGISIVDEPYAYRQLQEFYQELGGNQKIYLMLVANTVTMAQMLDSTATDKADKLLTAGAGEIAYLGVFRTPPVGYAPGANFMDADVSAAHAASKTFVQAQNAKLKFLRVLIEGRVSDDTSANVYAPNTAANGFGGVVLGGSKNDKSASVGLMLGRKVKYAAHIKIGKVANGPLSIVDAYIGTRKLNDNAAIVVAAVNETRATATLTITAIGADGDTIDIWATTANGWIYLGSYAKVNGDGTVTAVATAIKNAINAGNSGYTAASAVGVITITAPVGSGDTVNGYVLQPQINGTMTATKTAFTGGVTAKPGGTLLTDSLHDKGYITFTSYPNKAGFYYGVDNMGSTDDFSILVNGAVADAAARVAVAVYTEELESEVDTNADGTIAEVDAKHLEDRITQQVQVTLGDRISGFTALVDRTSNIINTKTTKIKLRVLPKGYNTYIDIDLGLTPNL